MALERGGDVGLVLINMVVSVPSIIAHGLIKEKNLRHAILLHAQVFILNMKFQNIKYKCLIKNGNPGDSGQSVQSHVIMGQDLDTGHAKIQWGNLSEEIIAKERIQRLLTAEKSAQV